MFLREHHQKVAAILSLLNAQLLKENACYFAGGTAIALRFGEYRESVDIDFMTSDISAYRNLRNLIREHDNLQPLLTNNEKTLELVSDIRADQYGIRTKVLVDGAIIKFEIVLEGRILFDAPQLSDEICGISTLSLLDLAASKILANSDRGLDSATYTRDIIDLAMMNQPLSTLKLALQKAEQAYGHSALNDLKKVIIKLEEKPSLLESNMQKMNMNVPQSTVWQYLREIKRLF